MRVIIGAIITLFLLLISIVFKCLCGKGCYDKHRKKMSGGNESEQNKIEKDSNYMTNMNKIIEGLSNRMSEELKVKFTELFKKISLSKDLPPVVTLDDIKYKLPYEYDTRVFKPSTHIGQRKLFLTELQFLTDEIEPTTHAIVVYAGAAPSNHTGYLSQLFPNVKFILVDPNPFDVYEANPVMLKKLDDPDAKSAEELIQLAVNGTEKIYIINDLFTLDLAYAVAKFAPSHYFISDIRTNVAEGTEQPDSLDILWNLSQQYNWMTIMKPKSSMLKFRHPFYNDDPNVFRRKCKEAPYVFDFELAKKNGIDFVENFETRKLVYWDGKVNIQAWPGPSSTESRLITDSTKIRDWGTPSDYEDKYFYYNSIERCYGLHYNNNADRKLGFDYCNDCALENLLWNNYMQKYSAVVKEMGATVKSLVHKLSQITRRHLIRENHGHFFGPYPYQQLQRIIDLHNKDPNGKHYLVPKQENTNQIRHNNNRFKKPEWS